MTANIWNVGSITLYMHPFRIKLHNLNCFPYSCKREEVWANFANSVELELELHGDFGVIDMAYHGVETKIIAVQYCLSHGRASMNESSYLGEIDY